MRLLYVDIDCLRPDHLSCYGYHRKTSPHIDRLAAEGVRFDNVYASDVPCLPSRTALFSGRFGSHTGVVGHGGTAADPYPDGPERGFASRLGRTGWMRCLRDLGLFTATVSSFIERHSAFHFAAGFRELINPGRRGLETADEIGDLADAWLERRARGDNWFLHVHFWDPHTPYRAPERFGERFAGDPLPAWLTDETRRRHQAGCGPHSASDTIGFSDAPPAGLAWHYPRQPLRIDSMAAARALFDGYDTGVLHADEQVGRLLATLEKQGVLADTAVIVSADHGENLGELNVYGDHQTADQLTCRVPLIVRWPGATTVRPGHVDRALHYQFDFAATVVQLLGGQVPPNWDGRGFADSFRAGRDDGREALVLTQGAWTCQRGVRFREAGDDYLCIHTYHDGYHLFPDRMVFDVGRDPHETDNLGPRRPDLLAVAEGHLARWWTEIEETASHPGDPLTTVLREGGPKHVRGELPGYLARLRATGRAGLADELARRHRQARHPHRG
jgi:arylsulfatase A-like enzyme